MFKLFTLFTLFGALFLRCQALNVTVESNSTDLTYSSGPGWNHADRCRVDSDGNILSKPGCVNIPSNCTDNVAMAGSAGASVNSTFFGDAIYLNGLSASVSGVFTVTINGDSTDVDGYGPSAPFVCKTLFSKTGLDPTSQHTISVALKGASPQSTLTSFTLMVDNFVYEQIGSSSVSATNGGHSSGPSSQTTSAPSPSSSSSASPAANSLQSPVFGILVAIFLLSL
ncbi:hypothetical protein C8J56DRAFT_1054983 [Mycena floridula]|nr:hypothetical protein C8J56DRAFT_1054983 [Mycena floridula]